RCRVNKYWPFADPSRADGTEEERLAVFRRVRDRSRPDWRSGSTNSKEGRGWGPLPAPSPRRPLTSLLERLPRSRRDRAETERERLEDPVRIVRALLAQALLDQLGRAVIQAAAERQPGSWATPSGLPETLQALREVLLGLRAVRRVLQAETTAHRRLRSSLPERLLPERNHSRDARVGRVLEAHRPAAVEGLLREAELRLLIAHRRLREADLGLLLEPVDRETDLIQRVRH